MRVATLDLDDPASLTQAVPYTGTFSKLATRSKGSKEKLNHVSITSTLQDSHPQITAPFCSQAYGSCCFCIALFRRSFFNSDSVNLGLQVFDVSSRTLWCVMAGYSIPGSQASMEKLNAAVENFLKALKDPMLPLLEMKVSECAREREREGRKILEFSEYF